MSNLSEYVVKHTDRNACTCGKCLVSGEQKTLTGHTVDMFFFDVCAKNKPDAETLKKLITEHQGDGCCGGPIDLFDGQEHSYMEVGGWIDDQGLAMQLMGLGVILGLWNVGHPTNMLGMDREHPLAQQLAGMGMVTIIPKTQEKQ